MTFRLLIELGDRTERRPLAPGAHVVGSSAECDVVIPHPSVSRRHARLEIAEGGAALVELGSRNGTWVDGRRIDGAVPLTEVSKLLFGTVAARLEDIDAGDLETAIELARAPQPESRAGAMPRTAAPVETAASLGSASPATTASIGSLRDFVVDELPRLVDLLAMRAGPLRLGQAVAQALYGTLPCRSVTLHGPEREGGERGVLFAAERTPATAASELATVHAAAGSATLEVVLAHESQAVAFAPLIGALGRLVGLAESSSRRPPAPGPESPVPAFPEPISVVPELRRIYEQATRVARGDVSVLIQGESGTGKEVLARFLHAGSPRRAAVFVALNCAALPRDLLEAELFGIEEKVATGVAARPGKFELADGGTLFLDEIGDMAPETQARILRVLQEGEVHRLGGLRPRPARVRVVAATNRDVRGMLAAGGFRGDLYHRIADWTVTLPPLRQRRADIPNLAAWFLAEEASRLGVAIGGISRAALALLERYSWPGNIRQLQREMGRVALFLEPGQLVESSHLDVEIRASTEPSGGGTLRGRLTEVERREIRAALAACGGDISAAARQLGLGRSTLYRRMAELGVERADG
jgi:DNA-binding NtrC family response regulator